MPVAAMLQEKRGASWSRTECSVSDDMELVSDSDSGVVDDGDTLSSARVWQRINTDNPPLVQATSVHFSVCYHVLHQINTSAFSMFPQCMPWH